MATSRCTGFPQRAGGYAFALDMEIEPDVRGIPRLALGGGLRSWLPLSVWLMPLVMFGIQWRIAQRGASGEDLPPSEVLVAFVVLAALFTVGWLVYKHLTERRLCIEHGELVVVSGCWPLRREARWPLASWTGVVLLPVKRLGWGILGWLVVSWHPEPAGRHALAASADLGKAVAALRRIATATGKPAMVETVDGMVSAGGRLTAPPVGRERRWAFREVVRGNTVRLKIARISMFELMNIVGVLFGTSCILWGLSSVQRDLEATNPGIEVEVFGRVPGFALVFSALLVVFYLLPLLSRLAGRHDLILRDGMLQWRGRRVWRGQSRQIALGTVESILVVGGRPCALLLLGGDDAMVIDEPMSRERADDLALRLALAVREARSDMSRPGDPETS